MGLKREFLRYLSECALELSKKFQVSKRKFTLSAETIEGLQIIGKYILPIILFLGYYLFFSVYNCGLTKYLLTKSEKGTYFLNPLENYFGLRTARGGGRNENPTVQQSLHNATAIL